MVYAKTDLKLYNDLIGKSYERYASGPDSYDCYTLIQEVYRRLNKPFPAIAYFIQNDLIHNEVDNERQRAIRLDSAEPWCFVTFRLHSPFVTHIGVALDSYRFLHAIRGKGVQVARFDVLPWKQKVEGFYRWIG